MSTPNGTINWVEEPGAPVTAELAWGEDAAAAAGLLGARRGELGAALERHGALYLRGLPVYTAKDFALVRDVLFHERATYQEKATPRSDLGDDVFSSTDLPPAQGIRMHNENSYTLAFPGKLLFGCLTAPEEGGATPVADVRKVLSYLPAELIARFRAHGWALTRNYAEHISLDWRTAFATDAPADVERYCAQNAIETLWGEGDTLRTRQVRSAVVRHPRTGEEVWFNHAAFWSEWTLDPGIREVLVDEFGREGLPFNTSFGDGTPLTAEEAAALDEAYSRATLRRAWRPGDLLLVDNVLMAHGRDPFRGARKIVVAMGDPTPLAACDPTTPVPLPASGNPSP